MIVDSLILGIERDGVKIKYKKSKNFISLRLFWRDKFFYGFELFLRVVLIMIFYKNNFVTSKLCLFCLFSLK